MQIKRRPYTDIDKGRLSMNTVDAVQNYDKPPNPTPALTHTPHAVWHVGMYHCTEGHSGILYICALWSLNKTTSKKKKLQNGGQKWLPRVEVSPDQRVPHLTVSQFCLKTFLHLQSQFIAEAIGLQRSVISRPPSGSCSLSQSWLWLAPSALSELKCTNTLGVWEFKIVWNFPSLSH